MTGATAVDVGRIAWRALTGTPGRATVLAVYRRAAYLRLADRTVLALTTTAAPRGPLHIRVAALPVLRAGQDVGVEPGPVLCGPGWRLRVPGPGWIGPAPLDVRTPVPTAIGDGELVAAVMAGDLAGVAARLGGRGPGLTPEGDDVLAGVLFTAAYLGDSDLRASLPAVAASVRTTDIAAAFLAAAAAGQCIEPAHHLLCALVAGDPDAAGRARRDLGRFGATSGPALAWGIEVAAARLPTGRSGGGRAPRPPPCRRWPTTPAGRSGGAGRRPGAA